jgi:uncharacterized protein YndB with AHSA1/START domain
MTRTLVIAGLALLALAVAVVLVLASRKPDTFSVHRSTAIKAPPEKIYPLIADFRNWGPWSPWERKDPAMKRSFSGAESGKGAGYAWEGNKDVGKGSMKVAEAVPPSKVVLNLDFEKPFEAHNMVTFTLAPKGDTTEVVWSMEGPTPFIGKIMHVFMDMDRMVGGDFEAGLANLKAAAEK